MNLAGSKNTPMWVGWNSKHLGPDKHAMQQICYSPQINSSPTSANVVLATLNMAVRIMEEYDQDYISVTYDLAIAKIALAIQFEEKPKFDKLFIQLGSFHIELSFFKALGKFIEDSGGPYMLIEAGVLAQGSLQGFLAGKHYNRCRLIHTLFASAMEILHFRQFLQNESGELTEDECYELLDLVFIQSETTGIAVDMPESLRRTIESYKTFRDETVLGKHGVTAKYWLLYVDFVRLYHKFSRSIRMADYKLYISLLPKIISVFFAFNHHNYARWLTRFHDNLLSMDETHPGIREYFERGIISIRRTNKNFSRIPIDLTLEQTINCDAASSSSGILNVIE